MSIASYLLSSEFQRSNYGAQRSTSWRLEKRSLIIVLLAAITFCLSMSFGMREAGDVGLTFQNGAKLILWVGLFIWGMVEWKSIMPLLFQPAGYILSFLGLYAALSALWSPVPLYTAASALGWLAYMALACLAIRYVELNAILASIFWALFAFIAVSFLLAFIIPDAVWLPPSDVENTFRFVGLTDHPNNFGHQAGLYLVFTAACLSRRLISVKSAFFHAAFGLAALGLSGDRTISIGLLAITCLVAVRYSAIAQRFAFGAALFLGLAFMFYAAGIGPDFQSAMESISRTGQSSEIMTLTGRTDIWAVALEHILEKPIFGWGFNGTEHLMVSTAPLRFFGNPVNAHEMFLQMALSLGLVGLVPSLALVAIPIRGYFFNPKFYRDLIVGLILLNGLAEADIFATPILSGLIVFLLLLRDGAPSPHLIYNREG